MALAGAGGGQLGCGALERSSQTVADLGAVEASRSHRSPLGRCPVVSPQPFLGGSSRQSTCAGGDHDFLPSRCRREEKGPRVPTDLPEEGRLRKISVQPFPAVQQSQDSCEWPNSDRVTPSCCLPGPSSIPSRAPPPSLLSPANANGWRLHARSLRWYPMRGAELWALPFPVGQQRWGLLSPPEQL